jgi:hypothetical protein
MFNTNFAGSSAKRTVEPDTADEYSMAFKTLLEKQGILANPKSGLWEVARKIVWLVSRKNSPFRVPFGKNARRDLLISKLVSPLTLQKMAAKLYGFGAVFKNVA